MSLNKSNDQHFLEQYETEEFKVSIDSDGNILIKALPDKIITLDVVKKYYAYIGEALDKLKLKFPRPLCIDVTECKSVSSSMGNYFDDKWDLHNPVAVINNHGDINKFANYGIVQAMRREELPIPVKVCSSIEEGMKFILAPANKPKSKKSKMD